MNLKRVAVTALIITAAMAAGMRFDAGAAGKPTIFIKNIVAGRGVNAGDASKLSRLIEETIINMGKYDVMSQDQVKELFETAARQQMMDCNSEACLKEIMRTTQTDYIIYGEILKEENEYLVSVKLMERRRGGDSVIKGSSTRYTTTFAGRTLSLLAGNIVKQLHGEKVAEKEDWDNTVIPEGQYRFMVICDPADAELYINGKLKKSKSQTYPDGEYSAILKSPGYEDYGFTIDLPSKTEYNIKMKRLVYKIGFGLEKGMEPGVDVYEDEKLLGTIEKSGLTLKIESGGHILTFKKEGYDDRVGTYNFSGDRSYVIKLAKSQYNLEITSSVDGTQVYINGKQAGKAPYSKKLEYGTYKIRVEKDGYLAEEKEITLDKNYALNFTMREKKYVEFRVETKPEGADVYFGGKKRGTAPGTFQFPEGDVKIEVEYEGIRLDKDITLKPGGKVQVIGFDFTKSEYKTGQLQKFGNIEMVYIEGGTFTMGSPESEKERRNDETQHRVTVSPFWMGKYEVTQKQYEDVMGTNPSSFKGDNLPVEMVSWYDAVEYCERFSKKYNVKARLPYEAEWEYACRAGTTTAYYWGNKIDGKYCWYYENSDGNTHPVGEKKPNSFGLYDMSGNVWEWCMDWYDGGYYVKSPVDNPKGPEGGNVRVLRGGSWYYYDNYLRSAFRDGLITGYRSVSNGFRVVVVR